MNELVEALVRARDWDRLIEVVRAHRKAWGYLIRLLYAEDEALGWQAVEACGRLMGALATSQPEVCREVVRRLLWALNEESGTAGRLVAPAVGEAIACAPEILGDFAGALLPALEEPYLQAGAAWAFGRIGQVRPDLVRDAVPSLQALLASPNATVREHAAWALDQILAPPQPVTPPPARSPTP